MFAKYSFDDLSLYTIERRQCLNSQGYVIPARKKDVEGFMYPFQNALVSLLQVVNKYKQVINQINGSTNMTHGLYYVYKDSSSVLFTLVQFLACIDSVIIIINFWKQKDLFLQ